MATLKLHVSKALLGAIILVLAVFTLSSNEAQAFKTGDIIFQESQSSQAAALKAATGSEWTHMGVLIWENMQWWVYEAVQPVKRTKLADWIARGKNMKAVIKRPKGGLISGFGWSRKSKLKTALQPYMGKNYDIYFEWRDDLIYCSELVYKAYQTAFGWAPGVEERFRDFNLDHPEVKRLIIERYKDQGRQLNLSETVVSPVSMFNDPNLETVFDSRNMSGNKIMCYLRGLWEGAWRTAFSYCPQVD